jgi:hypothetical protein
MRGLSAMLSPKAGSRGVRSLMLIGELSIPVDERELGPGVPERWRHGVELERELVMTCAGSSA